MACLSHPKFETFVAVERPRGRWPLAGSAAVLIATWIARSRQRRALESLDDRLRRDIGLTPVDVRRECDKPIWRP